MATIKPIEGRSVHQIQSGQVIVDLCSVVKELVENSLDASATSIEIRFKNNGLDSVEVLDNGRGIAPEDFETIALKHYTSKLSSYDDLSSLQTFGFRGEALSSLCALSKFHVVTARESDGPKGTRLDFEVSGKLKGTSVVASQKGTTIAVENLFHNLPVRRRELEKNIKREYGKVLGLLHAYACISVGVRFAVSNQAKGKKIAVFSTKANPTTRENIVNVYGAKTLSALIPLDLSLEMEPAHASTQSAKIRQDDAHSPKVRFEGHISRPVVGEGRQTPDRQMFFVNSRPCALPQIAKAVNEVYKSYNVTQSPFIFANLRMDTNSYDVNVSPDKRTILLHDQAALLEALKTALVKLFEEHDQSVPQAQLSARKTPLYKPLNVVRQPSIPESTNTPEQTASSTRSARPVTNQASPVSLIHKFAGRDAENRSQLPAPAPPKRDGPSKDKMKLANALTKPQVDQKEADEDQNGMSATESSSPQEKRELPRQVKDFNDRIASQQAKQQARSTEVTSRSDYEESISAVTSTPQRSSPGPVPSAFDRMRPKRTAPEIATVTVGNTTTTMTIGEPKKKRRIHTPKYDLNGKPLPPHGKHPGFVSSLRAFFAPGASSATSDGEGLDGEQSEEEENDNLGKKRRSESRSSSPLAETENAARMPRQNRDTQASGDDSDGDELREEGAKPAASGRRDELPRDGSPLFVQDDDSDAEYIDENEKKVREEARVAQMIAQAEEASARPTSDNLKRANKALKGSSKKHSTLQLVQYLETSAARIEGTLSRLTETLQACADIRDQDEEMADAKMDRTPEEKLSLTVAKSDFARMRIIGQFNLGFILAVRPGSSRISHSDELFIIDQHASDEKINFERLANSTILAPQRLVHPLPLDLTAIEEEIILEHPSAFAANGFLLTTDTSGDEPVGKRCRLLGLPVSKETTFTVSDLEELVALLGDSSSSIPRPGKVRRMLAMRACRSSIMVGKTLTKRQMEAVVSKMGEIDKPWNCPHGRPTMRHLASLEEWGGWREGDGLVGLGEERVETDWGGWMKGKGKGVVEMED
ncbi:DNA mismatch repair protein MutL [Saccharata proteae CBS 121410]|uniref:DNA mismatch repair protein PMS1 n=1 Tax=Saccharata proteae CBS 121410 TaxID=1314787 RepID=A0A6A5YF16_9PEZI|nr:DNA mismatch repair protein MutL [Saccharata proteae CBS 121410]